MATSVHHEAAIAFITALAADPQSAETFKQHLDDVFPGWRSNASPMQGYSTGHHHVSLIVGRSLHDALPQPYNALPYQWEQKHGFGAVVAYVEQAGRTEKEVDELLRAGAAALQRVITDAGGEPTGEETAKPAKRK